MIVKANDIAHKYDGLCSISTLKLELASTNLMSHYVHFTLDARHKSDEVLSEIIQECKDELQLIAGTPNGTSTNTGSVKFEHNYTSTAVHFNETCVGCVTDSATELFGADKVIRITGSAGHDSCSASTRVPSSMIFIPCIQDGVRHNFEEYSTPEEVASGFKNFVGSTSSLQ